MRNFPSNQLALLFGGLPVGNVAHYSCEYLLPGEHQVRQRGFDRELASILVLPQDLAADTHRMMCRRHRRDKAADFDAMLVMEAHRDKYLDGRSQYLCRDVAEKFLGGAIEQDV